jgi:hypothetical protein
MNKDQQIAFIREKCIEANLGTPHYWEELSSGGNDYWHVRPLHLADVLLAMAKRFGASSDTALADILRLTADGSKHWNLFADELREQSDETVEFISALLQ